MTPDEFRKMRRGKLDLTQVELAAKLGLSVRTISAYETGEMEISPAIILSMKHLSSNG